MQKKFTMLTCGNESLDERSTFSGFKSQCTIDLGLACKYCNAFNTCNTQYTVLVLCDTRDTSILIVDTYLTIPVSPKSRYTAVYRGSKKYRETAQVSRVSTIPRVSYHWETSSLQACDAKTNVIKSPTAVKQCSSSSHLVSHQVLLHCPSLGSIVIKEGLAPRGQRTRNQISKTSVDLKCTNM